MFPSLSGQQPYGQPQAQDLYSQQQFSLPQQPQSFNANILPQQMQWPPSLSPQHNTSWNQPAQSFPAPIQNGMGSHNGSLMQNQNALAMLSAMPLLPPQIVQDALRMCTPVGSSSNDELLMTQVLYDSTANGQTYRQALESLHGVNNHSATLWKDYYLDHKPRIDQLVSNRARQNGSTKKHMAHSQTPTSSRGATPAARLSEPTHRSHGRSKLSHGRSRRRDQTPVTSSVSTPRLPKRLTINSLTAHVVPKYPLGLLPPHADIVVPEPPSRSPTPPTRIVPGGRGNRYTDEDQEYFIKFISWRLKGDPDLGQRALCEMLAEKAPHHSVGSWQAYWHNHHDLPDKIMASVRSRSEPGTVKAKPLYSPARRPRPQYKDVTTSASESGTGSDYSDPEDEGGPEKEIHPSWDTDVSVDTDDDVRNMGVSGGLFTAADARILAKHIAQVPDWYTATGSKWVPFVEKYPQRSSKCWATYYGRHHERIDAMAQKIKQKSWAAESAPRQSIASQRGRPSWASKLSPDAGLKRKATDTEADDGHWTTERSKKQRNESVIELDTSDQEGSGVDADAEEDSVANAEVNERSNAEADDGEGSGADDNEGLDVNDEEGSGAEDGEGSNKGHGEGTDADADGEVDEAAAPA